MDVNKLSKLGGFLGGVAAIGGMILAILGYFGKGESDKPPLEISVSDKGTVTQKTIAKTEALLGLWTAAPLEIYTDISPVWLERKQTDPKYYYNPQVRDASVRFERAEQRDEVIANFELVNETFDHKFRAIVKVTDDDLWLLRARHQKQYGAEPNLQISQGELTLTESGRLRIDLNIADYANIIFFAEPEGR